MEDNVYEHIWMTNINGTFLIHKDFYIVKNGHVLRIHGDRLEYTGDSLEQTNVECTFIGKYVPKKSLVSKTVKLSSKELKKKLGL